MKTRPEDQDWLRVAEEAFGAQLSVVESPKSGNETEAADSG